MKSTNVYQRLEELGYSLPPLPPKGGVYKPVKQVGNLLYVSGQGATLGGVPHITGKLGAGCTVEQGQEAARLCALNALSTLHAFLQDLNRIKGVVKILGFVASAEGFCQQPKVMDGCSVLLQELFGEEGVASRSAIGVNELPGGIACEVEFLFELKTENT